MSFEYISEESGDSVSTSDMEIQQRQQDMSEEESFEEPVRSRSPVMWQHASPVSQQVNSQQLEQLPPPPTAQEIIHEEVFGGELLRHRIPAHLVNVFSDRWVGTHNRQDFINVTERLQQACENVEVSFIDVYKEFAPTTGHLHYHSVVIFKKKKSANSVIAIDPYGRWEPMRGQLISAWNYACKGGDRAFTYGTMPLTLVNHLACKKKQQERRNGPTPAQQKFNELVIRAKSGDETVRDEMIYARYQRYFDQLLIAAFIPTIYNGELYCKNLWIYGPPGTGKSRLVYTYAECWKKKVYNKLQNKWWDGFTAHEIVLVEDADPQTMKMLAAHMKVWTDRYPFNAEFKGTARMLNPSFELIVTSNYSIDECFNDIDSAALKRRFDVLEMF